MRISNVEWLKKRIAFIRKLGEKTARQQQIIDLLDDEASLSETETAAEKPQGTQSQTVSGGWSDD
ncbi:hypothetical protein [Klebsiella pneumoniae]|uniref:hypothetical protein n=1 Tax=Klebsiella pneumoniae TaxID=573 RepID=UPI0015F10D9D|nr:hypothetical protein [Klebsiella pneumoniae]